jgi:tetratricopeptide (TPR) repeat protein
MFQEDERMNYFPYWAKFNSMKKLLLLFVIFLGFLTGVPALSGQSQIDELLVELSIAKDDTQKVKLYNLIAFAYTSTNPAEGLKYAEEGLKLTTKLNWLKGRALLFNTMGVCYSITSEYEISNDYYQQALKIAKDLKLNIEIARNYGNIGLLYLKKSSDFGKAIEFYSKALNIYKKEGIKSGEVSYLINIGNIYFRQSDFVAAMQYYHEARKISEEIGNKKSEATILGNLGNIYYSQGEYEVALDLYLKAVDLHAELNNQYSIAINTSNIGAIYQALNDPENSRKYFLRAMEINERLGRKKGVALNLENISISYMMESDYKNALLFSEKANKMYEEMDDKSGWASSTIKTARILLQYSQNSNKHQTVKLHSAIDYLNNSINVLSETGELSSLAEANKVLHEIYYDLLDHEKAFSYFRKYKELNDSILSNDRLIAIANLEAKRENEIKDKEIAILSREKEIQHLELEQKKSLLLVRDLESLQQSQAIELLNKNKEIQALALLNNKRELAHNQLELESKKAELVLAEKEKAVKNAELESQQVTKKYLIALFSFLMISVAGLFYIVLYRRKAKFREKVVLTELKALRAQMNPHFIFNALGSIHNFVLQNNNTKASDYLLKFSRLMRLILNNSLSEQVPLEKEIEALTLYMQLEAARMQNKFSFDIIIDEGIDEENILIPPLLLQPFVENAIWHGIGHKEGPGYILVKLKKYGDLLHCTIEDNGIGRKKAMEISSKSVTDRGSVGIKITKERLQIINQRKKANGEIAFTDLPEGLRVEIQVPVENMWQ